MELTNLRANFQQFDQSQIEVKGWIRTCRESKKIAFIEMYDGSPYSLQLVLEKEALDFTQLEGRLLTGTSILARGVLCVTPDAKQPYELSVKELAIIGDCAAEYPLQKKAHTLEFLREIAHLRFRTNTIGASMRVRAKLALAVHQFFAQEDFYYIHSPIITQSDCEGAGEMFNVATSEGNFFGGPAFLSVSGQLEAEAMAFGLGKVYTFGPTFRAENSNTTRHLAEFWMIEPEVAFNTLTENIDLCESFVKYLLSYALENLTEDLSLLHSRAEDGERLLPMLQKVVNAEKQVLTYDEAIKLLEKVTSFEFPVKWGIDLQAEHEKYLTEHLGGPVFVINYPKEIKAFYMKANEDGRTVRAMDMLVPRLGELVGGSEREDRHDVLVGRIKDANLPLEHYDWYLDLRKYGSVPHSGFGLGFERLLMYVTGISNIRDVIPYPRYPGHA